MMLNKKLLLDGDSLRQLELVNKLRRLGLSYHFQIEINQMLENMNEKLESGTITYMPPLFILGF